MELTEFLDKLENAWKITGVKSGNIPDNFMTSQEIYIKKKAQINQVLNNE